MHRTFFRTLALVVVGSAIFFAAELAFEWWRLGMPGHDATSWEGVNNAKLVDLMSPLARAYNNILAMLIATIGLAIPLTANMHTPKLIDMFLRDRLNQAVLFLMAFSAANTLWVAYMVGPEFAPMWAVRFAVFGALLGWAILVPYFFYVVRFLDPSNILARLEKDVEDAIERVRTGALDPDAGQTIVHERLHQIGTIVIKSLDRTDRGVALEGIWFLKRLLDFHGQRKKDMPARWFVVDRADFVGLSAEAIALVQDEKLFFERKVLHQLYLSYQHAVSKASDVVSSISDANRVVAIAAAQRGDEAALQLSIRYFNNFLRESVKSKHVHSIYDVFHQYRLLATALTGRSDVVRDVIGYLLGYAEAARAAGLAFVPCFAAFDLASIALEAGRAKDPGAREIVQRVLSLPHRRSGAIEMMVLEAKLKLGAALAAEGTEEASLVRDAIADCSPEEIRSARDGLLRAPRTFHEVTDRQVDFRWVPPEQRPALESFVATIVPSSAAA
ncbi:DUF2254 family protein [Sandaracinus amylolyticus]|uniref:DUF2254 family protein n=1 Tax=Sandaracinus amylolyticus TaxID=927083 RepID=UPI001F1C9BBD|nr:DUF2254 family protein [Sandaracinus amylolyticus]UJR84532.1 Hypothetical protein I5071_66110 [Sandaracinus amylolyticus]